MVKEEMCEEVLEVRSVSERVTTVVVYLEEDVLMLIYGLAPQSGRSLEEKQSFHGELICEWDMHCAGDVVKCMGGLNGHVGRHIDGSDRAHGGFCVGQRNLEG